jgi:hypothetical protein
LYDVIDRVPIADGEFSGLRFDLPEEGPHVLDQQLRLFQGGEVAAAGHFGPVDQRLDQVGQLCVCAWTCLRAEVRRLLGRDDVVPGMVAAIQRGTRSRVAANSCIFIRTSMCC